MTFESNAFLLKAQDYLLKAHNYLLKALAFTVLQVPHFLGKYILHFIVTIHLPVYIDKHPHAA